MDMHEVSRLSDEQLASIESFEADYNAIDRFLRQAAGGGRELSFAYLVKTFERKHRGWRDAEFLLAIADLRNALVHSKTEPYGYVAVPTPAIAADLRAVRGRLLDPARADPTFRRAIQVVSKGDSLAKILRSIARLDFSQFPVYDGGRLRGLLTENGITRWLAAHVTNELSIVELEDVHAEEILRNEEGRPNFCLVARDTRVDDVQGLFATQQLLEAVFVTQTGHPTEKLLGIATRWDMSALR
jgi:predicted transcriptional regulator